MKVYGFTVDDESRCIHYHSDKDIVALQCAQCLRFYPCYQCHDQWEDHQFSAQTDRTFHAVLCGHCQTTLSIETYLQVKKCPHCEHDFNPNCAKHYAIYFG